MKALPALCLLGLVATPRLLAAEVPVMRPVLDGDPWQIAGDPDLGAYTDPAQQPVDFGIWQASDGSWQLWSCIRKTRCGGNTRLLHGWEGPSLTARDWTPKGIMMEARTELGERQGGLQAPHVIREGSGFLMFYGSWDHLCAATSPAGKHFERRLLADGTTGMFGAEEGANPRDPMVLRIGGLWHCYYAAHPNRLGSIYCRTSTDTMRWSEPRQVAHGGEAGTNFYSAECPFVVELTPGEFYLFRTQRYGQNSITRVYHSGDPMDFGINHDAGHLIGSLPVAAPEVFQHEGQWHVASLLPSLKGIQVGRLKWEPVDRARAVP